MDNRSPEVQLPLYAKLTCILISIVIIVYGLYTLQYVLVPLIFSVLFSILLYPLCIQLERRRIPRVIAIVSCLVFAIAIAYGLFYLVYTQIGELAAETPKLIERGDHLINHLQTFMSKNFNITRQRQIEEVRKYINQSIQTGGAILTSTLLATTNTLATVSLMPLYIFFFLLYRDFFRSFFYKVFGHTRRTKVDTVFQRIYNVVKDYLVGLVLVIFIVGTLNTVGLLILGVDYAVFFGFFGAVLILIPYFGIAIGSVLPSLFALVTKDNPLIALGVIGTFLFVQILEGNFITPYIVGSKVSINPLAAIIVLILWGQLWGVTGLILALPMTAIVKVLFDAIDATKPYGFLLGEAEKPRPPIKNIEDLADQLPKRVRKIGKTEVKK